jgi:UDPglucose 6-dehydrogenase
MDNVRKAASEILLADNSYDALSGADAAIIATDWNEFRNLDWKRISGEMDRPFVIDARNLLDPSGMKQLGFEYSSFGR